MPGRGAALPAARLRVVDCLGNIRFLGRSAIEAFADFRAKGLELGLAKGLARKARLITDVQRFSDELATATLA
jgi:hypothetical protein